MQQVGLGNTGLMVSRLGLGTDIFDPGGITLGQVTQIVLRAWELGINFIDTGRAYSVFPALAAALRHMDRSRLVLATKTYERTREGAMRDVSHALDEMRTDYIDLFLLHAVDSIDDCRARAGALEGLQETKAKGWIHHIGLSTHTVSVMRAMADCGAIEAVLTVLNLAGKEIRVSGSEEGTATARAKGWIRRIGQSTHTLPTMRAVVNHPAITRVRRVLGPRRQHRPVAGSREEMELAIRRSFEAGVGIYIMKPFARGRLFDDTNWDRPLTPDQVRQALAYLYQFPFIHSVVPGMRSVEQVDQNVAIVEELLTENLALP